MRCIDVVQVWERAHVPCGTRDVFSLKKQSALSEYSLCATLDFFVDVGLRPRKRYASASLCLLFSFAYIFHFRFYVRYCCVFYGIILLCVLVCSILFCFFSQMLGVFLSQFLRHSPRQVPLFSSGRSFFARSAAGHVGGPRVHYDAKCASRPGSVVRALGVQSRAAGK